MDVNSTVFNDKPLVDELSGYPYQNENKKFSLFLDLFWPVLILAGLLSNTVNIVVFLKVGVKDSVSILLLTLSISDLIFLILFSPKILTLSFSRFGTFQIPSLLVIQLLLFWPACTFYNYSAYISVFLGVARCACVAMPLRFKSVFTVQKTIAAALILFCVNVLLHFQILSAFRLGWVRDPSTNASYLSVVKDSPSIHTYKQKINDILNKNSIPSVAFIIMIASVALLSFKLFESSKLRSRPNSTPSTGVTSGKSAEPKQTHSHKLSPKDVKVVQSVILVCSIFIIAQLPSLIYTLIRLFWSGFNEHGRLIFLTAICIKVEWTFMMMNASLNVFVYYNYNSKFKSVFLSLFNFKKMF